ncbi:GNAT family N-acetyltransferase [Flavihumibacter sediminis]|nr:GNAT family N-acetyltransferase [Flavihumibacter sediminis]
MKEFLDNPVYYALLSGDAGKALGEGQVKYFDKEVSPFVGFPEDFADGFKELHKQLPADRKILYATRNEISTPEGWELIQSVHGAQFLYLSEKGFEDTFSELVPLEHQHVDQMVNLATLTKPGPFGKRTIDFGNYNGIFHHDELVAMTGRRLHVYDHIEISAVCTNPDYGGRGYAQQLIKHQVNSILQEKKIPFLHVRADNKRAIDLYEKLGFTRNGVMNFYFLRKRPILPEQ